jgi:hypothetical protein
MDAAQSAGDREGNCEQVLHVLRLLRRASYGASRVARCVQPARKTQRDEVNLRNFEKSTRHVSASSCLAPLGQAGLALLLINLALPGCSLGDLEEEDLGQQQSAVIGLNGMSLNGMSINGMSLNGMSINGMSLNGMSLNGMSLNGMSLDGSQISGLTGELPVSGAGLVGSTMNAQLSNGEALPIRIDSAETLEGPNADVWAYGLSYLADGTWSPLCGTQAGAPVLAVALAGTWNNGSGVTGGGAWTASSSSFTFGCRGTALAKCVEFGYKPWSTVGGTLLRDHHQACTRMLRADYCGDGTSWTADGTLINVYDDLDIQSDDASWLIDAEWTATGAVCTNNIRNFHSGSPGCIAMLDDPDCGDFSGGALLINEYVE